MFCIRCRQSKPADAFYPTRTYHGQRQASNVCKTCKGKTTASWQRRNPVRCIFLAAKNRAERKGLSFTLTLDALVELWMAQAGRCALSGLRFGKKCSPFSASLDRIDSSRGYVPGNVRFVLTALNYALRDYGLSVYLKIATTVLRKARNRSLPVADQPDLPFPD